jgi:hypothetical protein
MRKLLCLVPFGKMEIKRQGSRCMVAAFTFCVEFPSLNGAWEEWESALKIMYVINLFTE